MGDASMTTPEQGVEPASSAPLLQLPAELRNRIYKFALAPRQITLTRYPRNDHCRHRSKRRKGSWWPTLRRSALGLTQVCRQLRAEFLPLHQQAVGITVGSGSEMDRYVRDFFLVLAQANGSLDVAIRYGVTDFDLTSLMRTGCTAPGLKVGLHYKSWGWADAGSLKVVNDVLSNETWKKYFTEAVVKMSYSETGFVQRLLIEIKATAAEDWMPWYPPPKKETPGWTGTRWGFRRNDKERAQAAEEWRCHVGLEYPELKLQHIVVTVEPANGGNDGTAATDTGIVKLKDICWGSVDWGRAQRVGDDFDNEL